MSDRFDVKATEHGLVRLFKVELPPEQIESFDVADALGVGPLAAEQVELFDVKELGELGLSGYMIEGLGIAPEDLDTAQLDAVEGAVLILRSAAFGGRELTVTARAPLRWIGTYSEASAPVKFEALPDASAVREAPVEQKKRPSDAAMSGRVAMVALLVIFGITALMVWIA